MAALTISNVAETEHALSAPLNNAEAIYKANLDMKTFHQEVVRVVLLDSQLRYITKVEISKGTANASWLRSRWKTLPMLFWRQASLRALNSIGSFMNCMNLRAIQTQLSVGRAW